MPDAVVRAVERARDRPGGQVRSPADVLDLLVRQLFRGLELDVERAAGQSAPALVLRFGLAVANEMTPPAGPVLCRCGEVAEFWLMEPGRGALAYCRNHLVRRGHVPAGSVVTAVNGKRSQR